MNNREDLRNASWLLPKDEDELRRRIAELEADVDELKERNESWIEGALSHDATIPRLSRAIVGMMEEIEEKDARIAELEADNALLEEKLYNQARDNLDAQHRAAKRNAKLEAKLARVRERAFSDDVFADDEWYTRTRAALGSIRCILADTTKEGGNE